MSLEMIVSLITAALTVAALVWRGATLSSKIDTKVGELEKRIDEYRTQAQQVPLVIQRMEAAERQIEKLTAIADKVSDMSAKLDLLLRRHHED